MAIEYGPKVAQKIMNKFGSDVTIESVAGNHRAIIKTESMALDNASRAHDNVHLLSFMIPMPTQSMVGVVVTHTLTGDQYVLGQQVRNNGYLRQFEASLK